MKEMKVEQIYTGCLAQGAYYIESEGEVAIIDPLREVKPYIEKAKKKFGHDPKVILEEGVPKTIEWMKEIYGK